MTWPSHACRDWGLKQVTINIWIALAEASFEHAIIYVAMLQHLLTVIVLLSVRRVCQAHKVEHQQCKTDVIKWVQCSQQWPDVRPFLVNNMPLSIRWSAWLNKMSERERPAASASSALDLANNSPPSKKCTVTTRIADCRQRQFVNADSKWACSAEQFATLLIYCAVLGSTYTAYIVTCLPSRSHGLRYASAGSLSLSVLATRNIKTAKNVRASNKSLIFLYVGSHVYYAVYLSVTCT